MDLSNKNKRNLKRLRKNAAKLWDEQQSINERAAELIGKAGETAVSIGQRDVVPAFKDGYEKNVLPVIQNSASSARAAADDARIRVGGVVLPAAASVAGSVASILGQLAGANSDFKSIARDGRKVSRQLGRKARKAERRLNRHNNDGLGVGGWIGIGVGVVAAAGVAYALWQTFRADDDLWIADEELDAPVTTVKPRTATSTVNTENAQAPLADSSADLKPHNIPGDKGAAVPSVTKPATKN